MLAQLQQVSLRLDKLLAVLGISKNTAELAILDRCAEDLCAILRPDLPAHLSSKLVHHAFNWLSAEATALIKLQRDELQNSTQLKRKRWQNTGKITCTEIQSLTHNISATQALRLQKGTLQEPESSRDSPPVEVPSEI